MRFEAGVATDRGLHRSHNEDAVLVRQDAYDGPLLAVVADGMGGLESGEEASRLAVSVIESAIMSRSGALTGDVIRAAFDDANRAVWQLARDKSVRMGTTLVSCIVPADAVMLANAGDCRAYLWSRGQLQRLTRDHNLGSESVLAGAMTEAELRASPIRSIVTRSLGTQAETPEVDITMERRLEPGDQIVLCSDGLHTAVADADIAGELNAPPQAAADALVRLANAAGGSDNISVVVLKALAG
jgi:PPM family protein phosphatase